jgi:purine-binding chemotaxis protein CheW
MGQLLSAAMEVAEKCYPAQMLTFRVGREEYGIDILKVQEIRSHEAATRIAGAPPQVVGVLNLRGEIVPVVDLRVQLDSSDAIGASTVIIVLRLTGRVVGLVVDSVSEVVDLKQHAVHAVPPIASAIDAGHIQGVVDADQRMVILLDIESLVGDPGTGLA